MSISIPPLLPPSSQGAQPSYQTDEPPGAAEGERPPAQPAEESPPPVRPAEESADSDEAGVAAPAPSATGAATAKSLFEGQTAEAGGGADAGRFDPAGTVDPEDLDIRLDEADARAAAESQRAAFRDAQVLEAMAATARARSDAVSERDTEANRAAQEAEVSYREGRLALGPVAPSAGERDITA